MNQNTLCSALQCDAFQHGNSTDYNSKVLHRNMKKNLFSAIKRVSTQDINRRTDGISKGASPPMTLASAWLVS
jgi:hypothetical protein